jgi:hypothetical protein
MTFFVQSVMTKAIMSVPCLLGSNSQSSVPSAEKKIFASLVPCVAAAGYYSSMGGRALIVADIAGDAKSSRTDLLPPVLSNHFSPTSYFTTIAEIIGNAVQTWTHMHILLQNTNTSNRSK